MENEERRKNTPDSVREELMQCKTETGQQVEQLREEFRQHQSDLAEYQAEVKSMMEDWDKFLTEFDELLTIIRSGKIMFSFAGILSKGIKAIWPIVAFFAAVWVFMKTGQWHGLIK